MLAEESGVFEAVYINRRTGRIKDLGLVQARSALQASKKANRKWEDIGVNGKIDVFELSKREVLGCLEKGELKSYEVVISKNRDKKQTKHTNVVFGAAIEKDGVKMISVMVDENEVGFIHSKAMSDDSVVWQPNPALANYMKSLGAPSDKVTSIRSNDLGSVMVGVVSCFNTDYDK